MSEQVDEQNVLHRFLEKWRNPSEIAKETDLERGEIVELLERNDIEAVPEEGREEQVRFRNSEVEPSYLSEDIDGKYIAEDEVPALEDYVDGLANKLATPQIAEVVNSLHGEGTVSTEEVDAYLSQREAAYKIDRHEYEIRPWKDDDRLRVIGMRDILRQYHEDLDETIEEVKEESLRYG